MEKQLRAFSLLALLILTSCGSTRSSATSEANGSNASAVSSSSEGTSVVSVDESSPVSESSAEMPTSFTLDASTPITYEGSNGSFTAFGLHFNITKCDPETSGWISLSQGGLLSNAEAYSSFVSISVKYLRNSDFGYLTTKASSYPITSPENGAYEVAGATEFFFSGDGPNCYFSLFAPVGSFTLTSLTLTTRKETKDIVPITSLDFYTINDTHGASESLSTSSARQAGITKLSEFAIPTAQAKPEETIFLSSGDMWQGSANSNLTHGELMVNWMNVLGFESMAIGNHEFDWKAEWIAHNSTLANFPFLSINLVDSSGKRPDWAKASKVVVRGGVRIGVIGAIGQLQNSIMVSALKGYTLLNTYSDLVGTEAARLRNEEGCSLVVLSIHNGSFDTSDCSNIDAVFEGHTHQNYESVDARGIPHLQTYANGSNFQHAHFAYSNGKWRFVSSSEVTFATLDALGEEAMTLGIYGYYNGKNAAITGEVIGYTSSPLDTTSIARYAVQCMFEYYCNSTWDSALALAVVNTNCARQSIPAGPITYGQLYASLPFDNENVFCSCTGQYVKALKRNSGLYSYGTATTFDDTSTYHVMVISYVSEKASYASSLTEISRDNFWLRDITAADFRRNYHA